MTFFEKLRRRAAEVNVSRASRAVGLKPNAISSYISKGSMPRADIALKMARALEVPLEWLVDDGQDWPPPGTRADATPATMLTDSDLMREVLRRRRLALAELLETLKCAEQVDWSNVHRRIARIPGSQPIPPDLMADALLVHALFAKQAAAFRQFSPTFYDGLHRYMLPSGVESPEDLNEASLMQRSSKVLDDPEFIAALREVERHASLRTSGDRTNMIAWGTLARISTGEISLEAAERELASKSRKAPPGTTRAKR